MEDLNACIALALHRRYMFSCGMFRGFYKGDSRGRVSDIRDDLSYSLGSPLFDHFPLARSVCPSIRR